MGLSTQEFAAVCKNLGLDPMAELGRAEMGTPERRASIHPKNSNAFAPYRSKVEVNYAQWLEMMARAGVLSWEYEPEKWRLGHACFFTPDFKVTMPNGSVEWHETKGRQTRRRKDGSTFNSFWAPPKNWQKLKIAAAKWPEREIFVVFPEDSRMIIWQKERVPAGPGQGRGING